MLLSIFEIITEKLMQEQETGLFAFKNVRMLRTVRKFRIARHLRAVQTIIFVMVKSYKSFIDITPKPQNPKEVKKYLEAYYILYT